MIWTVVHSEVSGANLGEHNPLELEFGFRLSSIGFMSHDLPSHHIIHGGSHHAMVEPYATDFMLRRGDVDMMGGLVVEAASDQESELVHFAGLDWRHHLERRTFPFDPANPSAGLYAAVQKDSFTIAEEILNVTLAVPNSLDLSYSNGTSGTIINYRIDPGDQEDMYAKLNSLAEGEPGFDHIVTPDKQLLFYAPRKTGESGMFLEKGKNILKIASANKGIKATRMLGLGAGSSRRLGSLKVDTSLEPKYRVNDASEDFGDIINADHLSNLTQGQADQAKKPQRDLVAIVAPGHDDEFWDTTELGDMMHVKGDTGYDFVDDWFRLIAIDGSVSNQGDESLTLEFEHAET